MDADELFNVPSGLFVYAIRWRYFGEPRKMTPAEAETKNQQLALMKLEARWQPFETFMHEQGQFAEQVIVNIEKGHLVEVQEQR